MVPGADEVRVLVVGSDPLARAGLAALLADQPGCLVTGQIAGDADAADMLDIYTPDVVVWDLGWDVSAALEPLGDVREAGMAVVALLPDGEHVSDTWIAGARGLLLRNASVEKLSAALIAVARGLAVVDPALGVALFAARDRATAPPAETLTPRELQVLQFIAEGLPNKTIAARLHISEHTVKFHVNAILGKLGAQSRTEAVVRASRLGLVIL